MKILEVEKFHNHIYDKPLYHNIVKDDNIIVTIRKANTLNINENIQVVETIVEDIWKYMEEWSEQHPPLNFDFPNENGD